MTATKTAYDLCNYDNGDVIGEANLTAEELAHYQAMAQMPEGLIRLGALPHAYYDLKEEYQGTSENQTVFIDC